jgi:hypothetical protein
MTQPTSTFGQIGECDDVVHTQSDLFSFCCKALDCVHGCHNFFLVDVEGRIFPPKILNDLLALNIYPSPSKIAGV